MRPHQTSVVTELRGNLIRLRPFDPREIEAAWKGLALQDEAAHPRPRPEDRWSQPSGSFRRRLKRSGTLWRGCLDLAIDREAARDRSKRGFRGGIASCLPCRPGQRRGEVVRLRCFADVEGDATPDAHPPRWRRGAGWQRSFGTNSDRGRGRGARYPSPAIQSVNPG